MDERSACPGGRAGAGREGGDTPSRLQVALHLGRNPLRPGAAPGPHQQSRPQYWERWIAPLWGLRPITRDPRGGVWQPVPPVWAAEPHRRLVLFEGINGQSRDHAVGLSYTRQLWDSAGIGGGGGGVMHRTVVEAVAALAAALPVLTDVWSVVVPSHRDIQETQREPHIIRRIHPAVWGLWTVVHRARVVSRALAEGWEAGRAAAAVPHA